MKHFSKNFIAVIIILVICVIGIYFGRTKHKTVEPVSTGVVASSADSKILKPYIHSDNSFSFQMPGDFNSSDLTQEDGSETVLFVGSNTKRNFQIHIANYQGGDLTANVIKSSLPDILMESPEEIAVDGARGVAFVSGPKDGTLRTREIWFTRGNKLYQITTYEEFDNQMVDILTSWKWQ